MQYVRIQTAQNVGIDVEVAGLGERLLAALVDYAILIAYLVGTTYVLDLLEANSTAMQILVFLPAVFYFLLCELFLDGQSIGKKLRNLKVVRLDGEPPTAGHFLVRWLFRFVDITVSTGLVAVLAILVTPRAQRLGDLAAGTTVVKTTARARLEDTVYTRVKDDHVIAFPQVEYLTTDDIATARDVVRALIEDKTSHTTFTLGNRMKQALEAKMGVASELQPVVFLRTVIEDYNQLHGRL